MKKEVSTGLLYIGAILVLIGIELTEFSFNVVFLGIGSAVTIMGFGMKLDALIDAVRAKVGD